jgi:hypothetical protein
MSVTLSRVVRKDLRSGDPLPDVFHVLRRNQIRLRRGNLHLLAGKTGSMKTMFVLDLVKKMQVPTLYFSNDSDEATVAQRVLANSVQRTTEAVAEDLDRDKNWASSTLDTMEHVRWVFDPSPSLDDVDLEMEAFNEVYGDYPWLVVIDIMDNISYFEDSDHGSAARILQFLHSSARNSGAAVLVVHHCSEAADENPCPPRSSILQKQNKLPVLELTVANHGEWFFIAPVKNRHGPGDPSGRTHYRLRVNPSICSFSEVS